MRQSNIYVGLIGFRYGARVLHHSDLSYTELEYETALEAGIPRLLFLLDEDAIVPPRAAIDHDFGHRQHMFRQRLEAWATPSSASAPPTSWPGSFSWR